MIISASSKSITVRKKITDTIFLYGYSMLKKGWFIRCRCFWASFCFSTGHSAPAPRYKNPRHFHLLQKQDETWRELIVIHENTQRLCYISVCHLILALYSLYCFSVMSAVFKADSKSKPIFVTNLSTTATAFLYCLPQCLFLSLFSQNL